MTTVDHELERAKSSLRTGDYDCALRIYESLIAAEESDLSPYFGAAHIYEYGLSPKGVDLQRALKLYYETVGLKASIDSATRLAVARVIYKLCDKSKAIEAINLCIKSIEINENAAAYMLLGSIYEYWVESPKEARKYFLKAYRLSMPWGMRFYARSLIRSHRYLFGFLAHIWATISSPFFFIRYGNQALYG